MRPTTLQPALNARLPGLLVRVPEVHISDDLRRADFDESSRVMVVLELQSDTAMQLDLRKAKLGFTDVTGREEWRSSLASGLGEPPRLLQDDTQLPIAQLVPGKPVRAWVAFGNFKPRANPEIPERVQLVLPDGSHQRLSLSEPGKPPIWTGKPTTSSQSMGLELQGSQDEYAVNVQLGESRFVIDPLVFSYGYGIGVRVPQFTSTQGQEAVCCNASINLGVAWPLTLSHEVMLAPYLGVESALLVSDDTVSRRTWIGPAFGLELTGPPLQPRHGPFPINYPRSRLGAYSIRLALVHWFGPDRDAPSFGAVLSYSTAHGF